tara:strand:- start:290 stop:448 length:159 start_codon:yes stop_codon:yes gene_type:complete
MKKEYSICLLTNSEGQDVRKIMSQGEVKMWNLTSLFTGSHEDCIKNFNSQNL